MSGKLGQLCCSERKISTTMLQRVGSDTTKTQFEVNWRAFTLSLRWILAKTNVLTVGREAHRNHNSCSKHTWHNPSETPPLPPLPPPPPKGHQIKREAFYCWYSVKRIYVTQNIRRTKGVLRPQAPSVVWRLRGVCPFGWHELIGCHWHVEG